MKSLGHCFFSYFYVSTLKDWFSHPFSQSLRIDVFCKPENTFLTIHSYSWALPMQPDWNVPLIFWVAQLPNNFKGPFTALRVCNWMKISLCLILHSHMLKGGKIISSLEHEIYHAKTESHTWWRAASYPYKTYTH